MRGWDGQVLVGHLPVAVTALKDASGAGSEFAIVSNDAVDSQRDGEVTVPADGDVRDVELDAPR